MRRIVYRSWKGRSLIPACCFRAPLPDDLSNPRTMTDTINDTRMKALTGRISECGGLLIAFSGGVDSGLLAALAKEILGENVHAVFIDGPLEPRSAVREAQQMAGDLDLSLEIISVPFPDDTVCSNLPDRCYHCKKSWSQVLRRRAAELGLSCVADGANFSDESEHRPGIRASTEEGIIHPFIEAGMTKADIRYIARERGLPFWDKPSAACLASRIPYGETITDEKLRMVEAAENILHKEGFCGIRVRIHGGIARIEVTGGDMHLLIAMRDRIVPIMKEAGFSYVTLDLEGYRSGSMDEALYSGRSFEKKGS
ncbi:MAG: ATP-dependent sacrificial sulfur transferase LarE [Methanoregulaceae archaeon]|nr:ATP-dependent sacrificial sulfur transferase LarE [Methanoregulaceae archaeon]